MLRKMLKRLPPAYLKGMLKESKHTSHPLLWCSSNRRGGRKKKRSKSNEIWITFQDMKRTQV